MPGETLGMLGGGQLGRMFALAARPFGYRIAVYGDPAESPCGQVADRSFAAGYEDFEALAKFARDVSVVSYETENVSLAAVEFLEQRVPVFPNSALLRLSASAAREACSAGHWHTNCRFFANREHNGSGGGGGGHGWRRNFQDGDDGV